MQTFRSKIDWWVLGFFICFTGMLVQLLLTMYAKGTMQQYPEHTLVYCATIILLWWPVLSTHYQINNDVLTIRCMLFKWQIPLSNIQKVSKTDNFISSPALSLDRLRIDYAEEGKTKFILVSPRNKQAFEHALQQIK